MQIVLIVALFAGAWAFGRVAYEELTTRCLKTFWEQVDAQVFRILSVALWFLALSELLNLCR